MMLVKVTQFVCAQGLGKLTTHKCDEYTYCFCLRHVGDDSIGDDEQDEVLRPVAEVPGDVGHVLDCRREVCRPVQLDVR